MNKEVQCALVSLRLQLRKVEVQKERARRKLNDLTALYFTLNEACHLLEEKND